MANGFCSKCKTRPAKDGQRHCRLCHNTYMRGWRPKYSELPEIEKRRSIVRAALGMQVHRGQIDASKCAECGSSRQIERHHPDIDNQPKVFVPLCRPCHYSKHGRRVLA